MSEQMRAGKMNNSTKNRLIYLLRYLYETTDKEQTATTYQLLEYLESKDIPTDRKTLRADLRTLIDAGMDIVIVRSKPNRYYWAKRSLELSDLRLLVDAIATSPSITTNKCRQLSKNLGNLISISQRSCLKNNLYLEPQKKICNDKVYDYLDSINTAICSGHKVCFQQFTYGPNKEQVLLEEGAKWAISPYYLHSCDGIYYLIGWCEKEHAVANYRVDHMKDVTVLPEEVVQQPGEFDMDAYVSQHVGMHSGQKAHIVMECDNEVMEQVIDRFGIDVKTQIVTDQKFSMEADVVLSSHFYAWVFQFGGKVRILSPKDAVLDIRNMAWGIVGRKLEFNE